MNAEVTQRNRQKTIAELRGIDVDVVPVHLETVVELLHRKLEAMGYVDTLVFGNFVLELIEPDKGYPYFLLHHVIRNDGKDRCYVVHLRVNHFDPQQIRKQLTTVRRRLAVFLALCGWKPEAVKLVKFGAFTDADAPMYRKRHLF